MKGSCDPGGSATGPGNYTFAVSLTCPVITEFTNDSLLPKLRKINTTVARKILDKWENV